MKFEFGRGAPTILKLIEPVAGQEKETGWGIRGGEVTNFPPL